MHTNYLVISRISHDQQATDEEAEKILCKAARDILEIEISSEISSDSAMSQVSFIPFCTITES